MIITYPFENRSPDFSKLPTTIIPKRTVATAVTISRVVVASLILVFFYVLSVGNSPFLLIPVVLFIVVICKFFVFGRTIYKIDEHVVRARYTGLFNTETDFEEPVQAYRAIECDRHFD